MVNEIKKQDEIIKNQEFVKEWRKVPGDLDDFIFYKEQGDEVLYRPN
jgi:hypothetical protein